MNRSITKLPLFLLAVVASSIGNAQEPDTRPAFEVASIKPSKPGTDGTNIHGDANGTLRVENATLKDLIRFSYEMRDSQIAGGPKWLDADRFDIAAKPESRSRPDQVLQMMQRLLAERFQLALHRESREARVYELVVAREGPKLGAPKDGNEPGLQGQKGHITARATAMAVLARYLSQRLGEPVVDKTGLSGSYDFSLEYEPDGANDATATGPSIFTAIQEQLGLRLQPAKGAVDVLVIDRAEKPSEN